MLTGKNEQGADEEDTHAAAPADGKALLYGATLAAFYLPTCSQPATAAGSAPPPRGSRQGVYYLGRSKKMWRMAGIMMLRLLHSAADAAAA